MTFSNSTFHPALFLFTAGWQGEEAKATETVFTRLKK